MLPFFTLNKYYQPAERILMLADNYFDMEKCYCSRTNTNNFHLAVTTYKWHSQNLWQDIAFVKVSTLNRNCQSFKGLVLTTTTTTTKPLSPKQVGVG